MRPLAVRAETFGRPDGADPVHPVGSAKAWRVAWVFVEDGAAVGHVAFSPAVDRDDGSVVTALGSAPIAVLPGRRGAGSRRARTGLGNLLCRPTCLRPRRPEDFRMFRFEPAKPLGFAWERGGQPGAPAWCGRSVGTRYPACGPAWRSGRI